MDQSMTQQEYQQENDEEMLAQFHLTENMSNSFVYNSKQQHQDRVSSYHESTQQFHFSCKNADQQQIPISNFYKKKICQKDCQQQNLENEQQSKYGYDTVKLSIQTQNAAIQTISTINILNYSSLSLQDIEQKSIQYINKVQKKYLKRQIVIGNFQLGNQIYGSQKQFCTYLKDNFFKNKFAMSVKKNFQEKNLSLKKLIENISIRNQFVKMQYQMKKQKINKKKYSLKYDSFLGLIDQQEVFSYISKQCENKYQQQGWMKRFIESFNTDIQKFLQCTLNTTSAYKILSRKIFYQYSLKQTEQKYLYDFQFKNYQKTIKNLLNQDLSKTEFTVINKNRLKERTNTSKKRIHLEKIRILSQQFEKAFEDQYKKNNKIIQKITQINKQVIEQVKKQICMDLKKIGIKEIKFQVYLSGWVKWKSIQVLQPIKVKKYQQFNSILKEFKKFFDNQYLFDLIKQYQSQDNVVVIQQEKINQYFQFDDESEYQKNTNLTMDQKKILITSIYNAGIDFLLTNIQNYLLKQQPLQIVLKFVHQNLQKLRKELKQIEVQPSTQATIQIYNYTLKLYCFNQRK